MAATTVTARAASTPSFASENPTLPAPTALGS